LVVPPNFEFGRNSFRLTISLFHIEIPTLIVVVPFGIIKKTKQCAAIIPMPFLISKDGRLAIYSS
jgi:hypothetical protein